MTTVWVNSKALPKLLLRLTGQAIMYLCQFVVAGIKACQVLQLAERLQRRQAVARKHQRLHVLAVCYRLWVVQVCVCDVEFEVGLLGTTSSPTQL